MNSPNSSSFRRLIALCQRNKILELEADGNVITGVKYGPLGLLLRKNIFKEWFSFSLFNNECTTLPVHVQKIIATSPALNTTHASDSALLGEIVEQYSSTQSLVGHDLPLALSSSCGCVSSSKRSSREKSKTISENSEDPGWDKLLWRPKKWTSLLIAFFCDPKKSTNWFYFWQRQRYIWWRKFSAMPSQFSMSDITQKNNEDQVMSLRMNFSWGDENVETISLIGNRKLQELHGESFASMKDQSDSCIVPSVILCKAELDFAVMAYLYDSFEEKQLLSQESTRSVLRMSHRLAPYKVTIAIDSSDDPPKARLLADLSSHLTKEFKRSSITVLPNPHSNHSSLESQFKWFDEMGIPYIIVLSEMSLATGLACLRNRDTTLQEQVHITELLEKLLVYLQMLIVEPS